MSERDEIFNRVTKGVPVRRIAKALNTLTSGISWYGCGKPYMRAAFRGEHSFAAWLGKTTEAELKEAIDKVYTK